MNINFDIKNAGFAEVEALRSFARRQYKDFTKSWHQYIDDEGYNENSYYFHAVIFYQSVLEQTEEELHNRVKQMFSGFPKQEDYD